MEYKHWLILTILIIVLILTTAGGFILLFMQNRRRDKTLSQNIRLTLLQSHELEKMRNSMFRKEQ